MDGPLITEPPLRALLLRNKAGEVYKRTEIVERQIREALVLDSKTLIGRARMHDYKSDKHLKEECIVYLIKHYRRTGENQLTSDLFSILFERCASIINYNLRALNDLNRLEAYSHAIDRMTDIILAGKSCYFEVRFQNAIERISISAFRKFYCMQNKLDAAVDVEQIVPSKESAVDMDTSAERIVEKIELSEIAKKGLMKLEKEHREAYILRFVGDWPIESNDPKEPTISKRFGKTPRTIQNWLAKTTEFLRRYCEEGA